MSERTSDQSAGGRRDEILAAAVDVCAARGFGGATLREIAAEAGIKKGLLTYYFPTKDDLVFAAITGLLQQFDDESVSWAGSPDDSPDQRLVRWLRGHAELTCRLIDHVRVAYECTPQLSSERRAVIEEARRRHGAQLGELIDDCRTVMPIADLPTESLARTALGVVAWAYQWFERADADHPEQRAAAAAALADRAVASILTTDR